MKSHFWCIPKLFWTCENIGVAKMYECSFRKYFTKFFGEPRSGPEELYAALYLTKFCRNGHFWTMKLAFIQKKISFSSLSNQLKFQWSIKEACKTFCVFQFRSRILSPPANYVGFLNVISSYLSILKIRAQKENIHKYLKNLALRIL